MKQFSVILKKEMMEGLRTQKYLIIFVAFMFFALFDPLMMKLMPIILENQVEGMNITLPTFTVNMSISSIIDDSIQIVPIVMAIVMSGMISKEYRKSYAVVPSTKGLELWKLPFAKLVSAMAVSLVGIVISLAVGAVYSDLLFTEGNVTITGLVLAMARMSILVFFYWCLYLFFDMLITKSLLPTIATLVAFYASVYSAGLVSGSLGILIPGKIISNIGELYPVLSNQVLGSMGITSLYAVLLLGATVYLTKKRSFESW